MGVLLSSVAFYHGSELTSTAVDDKGIVQFYHKLVCFFKFKSVIFKAGINSMVDDITHSNKNS